MGAALAILLRTTARAPQPRAVAERARTPEQAPPSEAPGAASLGAARVQVLIKSEPAGATLSYPGGSALTPARILLPRGGEPLALQVHKDGFVDEVLTLTPDVPREHFVALTPLAAAKAGVAAEDEGESDAPAAQAEELERFVDGALDSAVRACCREAGPCGQVLLEGEVSERGRWQRLKVRLSPQEEEAARCLNGVLRAARRVRVQVAPGASRSFQRSYGFDAPGGGAGGPP